MTRPARMTLLGAALLGASLLVAFTPAEAAKPSNSRSLVVLVHGWAGDRRVWLPVKQELHEPAVAIDLPGHGADRQDVSGWPISRFSEAIDRLRRRAHARCLLIVTHSNGSYVALDYWRHHSSNVAGMVVVEGNFTRPFKEAGPFKDQIAKLTNDWPGYAKQPFGLERARPQTAALVRKVAAEARLATARATLEMLVNPNLWEPTRISVPVTFALTESPSWTDAERARMRATAPNATFVNLGTFSHYAHLDDPRAVAKVIDQAFGQVDCGSGPGSGRTGVAD